MITANVRFLTNTLVADLTCKSADIQDNLQSMGILTPLSLIKLDNARTLQIQLLPDDELGNMICGIVNPKSDTLGNVQRLCRFIYCMNEQHRTSLINKIKNGDIQTVAQGVREAEKVHREKTR
ncbi:MAG: hypothetical protein IJT23_11640 [Clostridia bacterium]|nr:hypothetical protein [Clostridia bacterium]